MQVQADEFSHTVLHKGARIGGVKGRLAGPPPISHKQQPGGLAVAGRPLPLQPQQPHLPPKINPPPPKKYHPASVYQEDK